MTLKLVEEAETRKDGHALETFNAEVDNLERLISPEYTRVMDGPELSIQIPPRESNLPL
jgi:hypothetical protein